MFEVAVKNVTEQEEEEIEHQVRFGVLMSIYTTDQL